MVVVDAAAIAAALTPSRGSGGDSKLREGLSIAQTTSGTAPASSCGSSLVRNGRAQEAVTRSLWRVPRETPPPIPLPQGEGGPTGPNRIHRLQNRPETSLTGFLVGKGG